MSSDDSERPAKELPKPVFPLPKELKELLFPEGKKYEETKRLEYLVLAIGRQGGLPDWVLEACRGFADDYETSLHRFDDKSALGDYKHDIDLLIEMGRLVWAGRGIWSAAAEVARSHETDETASQTLSVARRLYNIWNRERETGGSENRWQGEAMRRFLASDELKAAVDRWLQSEDFPRASDDIPASQEADAADSGD